MYTVSIIVISYNQEKTIAKALDSLLSQKTNYSYQIVISDDNSDDSTYIILQKYKEMFPHKILLNRNKSNLGIVGNYFTAYHYCLGKYICCCAGDDWWVDAYKIQKQVDVLENYSDVGLVYSNYLKYDEVINEYTNVEVNQISSIHNLLINNFIPALTVCYRRLLIDEYVQEIIPQKKIWIMEDYPMWLWLIRYSKFYHLKDFTSVYRITSQSVTHADIFERRIMFQESVFDVRNFYINLYKLQNDAALMNKNVIDLCYVDLYFNQFPEFSANAQKLHYLNLKSVLYKIISYSRVLFLASRFFSIQDRC